MSSNRSSGKNAFDVGDSQSVGNVRVKDLSEILSRMLTKGYKMLFHLQKIESLMLWELTGGGLGKRYLVFHNCLNIRSLSKVTGEMV